MKIGIVLQSNDAETAWNALRFAVVSREASHDVNVFLLGKGVETEAIHDSKFDVQEMMKTFLDGGGLMYACGTCLQIRKSKSQLCPVGNMQQLLGIVEKSDRLLVF